VIRAQRAEDGPAVRAVVLAAFGADEGPTIADLVDDLRAGPGRAELVAEKEGRLVGHVMLSRCWVDAREALVDVLVLSPLSVAPDRQGRGVGGELLRAALEEARRLDAPAVFLEGSPDYYSARGFEAATPRGFVRPSVRIPEPAFQVALLPAHRPWMTGALVYCEPFWARDCVGLRDPELTRLEHLFEA